ncbi:cellulase family glycosylhydrolase [Acuticoccus mangrovi]|uniref:cellulase n=1 Tax=Acuticoccus mangrovi TaxID=2796142 RepID=A0A934MJP7_9HYPH|nr:cellulase family glycosylhydrolase [Acuticoccus mangrovi]MBJ3774764.1 cellulase family glycosylhydrolase [Acuticoccus mangrovi]
MTDVVSQEARLSTIVRERWDSGAVVDLSLEARVPIEDWRIEIDPGGRIVNIWNAQIVSQNGSTYVLGAADYNEQISPGGIIDFGFEMEGTGAVRPLAFEVDIMADAAQQAAPTAPAPQVADTPPAPISPDAPRLSANGMHLRETDATAKPGHADVSVEGSIAHETPGDRSGLPGATFAPGPFAARGAVIVDAAGEPAEINGLNWFGFETETFAPHGLWARNWREMMDEVKSLGFNVLRLPLSGELVDTGGTPTSIDLGLNPDLEGLSGLEILDAIVDYADKIGLRVLLDYHRGSPGSGPNDNGLWYGDGRTEGAVIGEWETLARRYGDKPAVIGADLMNEPHAATWGDGSATDWAAAAERIGDAILGIAPNWLIVVEGVSTYDGDTYWWGGNLQGARDHPVTLSVPDRLVYSAHDYPPSVHPQPWFTDGTDLADKFRQNWGYLVEDGTAPVLIGEWGSKLETPGDARWADAIESYMQKNGVPWMWWSLNPNSGDTGGLFEDDWSTVRTAVTDLLDPFLVETRPDIALSDDIGGHAATFTVNLAQPADSEVTLKFATTDGTAAAGLDYVATAGTLTFGPGEQQKTVNVPLLPDTLQEGNEFFYLVIGGSDGVRASGTAVIVDDDAPRRGATPFVDVASTVVNEGAGAARFRIVLSEPANHDVSIDFTTRAESAGHDDFQPTKGTVVIPAGEIQATLEVGINDDSELEKAERFTMELTSAEGAEIRGGEATGLIAAEPPGTMEIDVSANPTGETQLTIDLILSEDWGTGSVFNVVINNVSDQPVSGWRLAMDLPFDIEKLWSAELVADEGERVTLQNVEWNGTIAPGQTVDFGFVADEGGIDLGTLISGADLELTVQ